MAPDLKQYDEEQARLMEEMCIVVDENDKRIGADTKKICEFVLLSVWMRQQSIDIRAPVC